VTTDLGHERPGGRLLRPAEREEVGFVAAGNDQRMTGCPRDSLRGESVGSLTAAADADRAY